jgi:hypothetical protein
MMKERTHPKSVAPRKVKGTVLFTVVVVMMVLIVFLMGALALASTANQRAMNTYNTVQTQATAKAGVNAILSAIQNEASVATAAAGVNSSNPHIAVSNFSFERIGSVDAGDGTMKDALIAEGAMGRITEAGIEYVGKKAVVDPSTNAIVQKDVIKLSATAVQGTATSTYCAYLLRDAVLPSNTKGANKGFVSTGNAASGNHTSVYGGSYFGFDQLFKTQAIDVAHPFTTYKLEDSAITFETDVQVNGNLSNDSGSDFHLVNKSTGSGLTVWGNLLLSHPLYIESVNTLAKNLQGSPAPSYTKIPYIYVEGDIDFNSGLSNACIIPKSYGQTYDAIGKTDVPLNIFCHSIKDHCTNAHGVRIMGNLFCYGTDEMVFTYAKDNTTGLYKWAANFADKDGHEQNGTGVGVGGNFYTMGSLKLTNNSDFHFNGDVYIDKNLTLEGGSKMTVTGNLYVKGSKNIAAGCTCTSASENATTFPLEYTKEYVLGEKGDAYKIVRTVKEVLEEADNPYATTYAVPAEHQAKTYGSTANIVDLSTGTVSGTGVSVSLKDASNTGGPKIFEVSDSCRIKGSSNNGSGVVVHAPASASQSIWIVLEGTDAASPKSIDGGFFIIDDKGKDGTVNILVEKNFGFSGTGSSIVVNGVTVKSPYLYLTALSTVQKLTDTSHTYQIYTDDTLIAKDSSNQPYPTISAPNLNIYCAEGSDTVKQTAGLYMHNTACITGNIKAPYLKLSYESQGGAENHEYPEIYYNNFRIKSIPNTKLGCIGCCIVNEFYCQNNWELLYAPSGGGSEEELTITDPFNINWEVMNYDCY